MKLLAPMFLALALLLLPSAPTHAQSPTLLNPAANLVSQSSYACYYGQPFLVVPTKADWLASLSGVSAGGGVFVPVVARVTNEGMAPDDPAGVVVLIDDRGRTFTDVEGDALSFSAYRSAQDQYKAASESTSIQPGLSATVLFVFQVAPDVQSLTLGSRKPC